MSDRSEPPSAAFQDALVRVEGSETFRGSRQARILLRYLVERVLAVHGVQVVFHAAA
jgi:hypothetical protein